MSEERAAPGGRKSAPPDVGSGEGELPEPWAGLVGKRVVVDTDTSYIYIGTLEAAAGRFLTLTDVDVHDMSDSTVTKEIYTLEAMKFGVRSNRKRAYVRTDRAVSVSLLDDVIRY